MHTFELLVEGTAAATATSTQLTAPIVGHFVDVKGQEAAKGQRLDLVNRIGTEFEFPTILCVRCKVSSFDVEELFFELDFDGESGWPGRPWNPHMIRPLINDAECWLRWVSFLVKRHHLHDVGVADPDSCSVGQRDNV